MGSETKKGRQKKTWRKLNSELELNLDSQECNNIVRINFSGDQDGEKLVALNCSCPLTGDLTSFACVCVCMVNGIYTYYGSDMNIIIFTIIMVLFFSDQCRL